MTRIKHEFGCGMCGQTGVRRKQLKDNTTVSMVLSDLTGVNFWSLSLSGPFTYTLVKWSRLRLRFLFWTLFIV